MAIEGVEDVGAIVLRYNRARDTVTLTLHADADDRCYLTSASPPRVLGGPGEQSTTRLGE